MYRGKGRRRLEPSLGKSKNSLGNTWMVLGVFIYEVGEAMSHGE